MKRDYPNLCKPLRIGNLTLRNRMCSAPMGATDIDKEGTPGPRTLGFYEARAKGGAAIVTVSELVVHPQLPEIVRLKALFDCFEEGQIYSLTWQNS